MIALLAGISVALPLNTFSVTLDNVGNHTLYWQLDYEKRVVALEVQSKIPPTGWLAVGFSDYGDILNADLCIFWPDWRGKVNFQVAHISS